MDYSLKEQVVKLNRDEWAAVGGSALSAKERLWNWVTLKVTKINAVSFIISII